MKTIISLGLAFVAVTQVKPLLICAFIATAFGTRKLLDHPIAERMIAAAKETPKLTNEP